MAPTPSAAQAGDPSSTVRVTTVDAFYDVVGTDRASIVGALRRQGPRDASGAWTGSLSWIFNWTYQPVREGGACRANAASVDLRLTYTLPRLAAAGELSPVVRESWERFHSALRYHEGGHAALAIEAANGLVRDIEAAPPARTCVELRSAVESTVQANLARHEDAQVGYDRQTRHGVAQGATFSNRESDPAGH
jgi:predicted secreted Zn-dependent protease